MFISHLFHHKPSRAHSPLDTDVSSFKTTNVQPLDDMSLLSQGFSISRRIGEGNFDVYQIITNINAKSYVLKAYPYKNGQPDPYYLNEIRFMSLNHPNIIPMICRNDKHDFAQPQGGFSTYSYMIMEYAPYGDFLNFIMSHGDHFTDKLVRTYFRQLISGLEFLHASRGAHLDLKPENLLIGADFNLKITDFDVSYIEGDKEILSDGTISFRCPEISRDKHLQLHKPSAVDLYSAGVLLFVLKSGGVNPYFEDRASDEVDLLYLMNNNNAEFWRQHCQMEDKLPGFYDDDFIELFNGMTMANPDQRFTVEQIKNSRWYNGPIFSREELQVEMTRIMSLKPDS